MQISENSLRLAREVLPGYGAFGAPPGTRLKLNVNGSVDRLVFALESPGPEYLSLMPAFFFGEDGKEIPRADICSNLLMSSIHGDKTPQETLTQFLTGKLIQTTRETDPVLEVGFHAPVYLSRIDVPNRGDAAHGRARYLRVEAYCGEKRVMVYRNMCPETWVEHVNVLARKAGLETPAGAADSVVMDWANQVKRRIPALIEADELGLDARQVAWLLPVYGEEQQRSEFNEIVCAEMILTALKERSFAPTSTLKLVSQFLGSDIEIEAVRARANALLKLRGDEDREIVISKHSIHLSRLTADRDKYLDGLDKVFSVFRELEIPLMLSYGSLLGAVRSGSFLPHDDDVDLLYFDGAASQAEIEPNKRALRQKLEAAGVRVGGDTFGKNFHVYLNGISLDLFPSWRQDGRLFLLMQKMAYRDIAEEIVLPPSTARLHGRVYPAPANPEAFLCERYGEGWTKSDPYHEWPWQVSRQLDEKVPTS